MTTQRHYSPIDRLLLQADAAMRTLLPFSGQPYRPSPAIVQPDVQMSDEDTRHVAGLMRINHTGEVCAQALYLGQAAVARDAATRAHLLQAAEEETDHLAWCHDRLEELASRPSLLNPLWYAGAWAIGAAAGLRGDGWNLGFVVETERQVEAHLDHHLGHARGGLPAQDARSRAIVAVMKDDEVRHADNALAAGARRLPAPVPALMGMAAELMRKLAYRI